MVISVVFFALLAYLVVIDEIAIYVLWFYAVISLLTLLVYAWDKSAARKNRWRVRERTLHFMSMIGGWPGALIGQQQLRHKSRKWSFLWVFYLTVVINIAIVVWFLHSETGALIRSWVNQ